MSREAAAYTLGADRQRWWALAVQCLGMVMIVIDSTVVNVSLPSMQTELGLSPNTLVWIVNAYVVPYSGLLLVAGRLGDRCGHRRVFLLGILGFTLASLTCGMATGPLTLVAGRALQGICGAAVAAVGLSLILTAFQEPAERARALAVFSFVCAGGGSLGVLLGGVLTSQLNWRWIFLVNIPIGMVVCALAHASLPRARERLSGSIDIRAAAIITLALMLAIWGTLQVTAAGTYALQSLLALGTAAMLIVLFVAIEARSSHPLIPRTVVKDRDFLVGLVAGALWSGSMFAWSFTCPLYLQKLLGYDALEVGLTFLPANLVMGVFALGLSARLATRLGVRNAFCVGLGLVALGMVLCARLPLHAQFARDVLAPMLLVGLGTGIAYNPLMLAALRGIGQGDYGAASGLINSSLTVGGAIALALFAGIGAAYTRSVLGSVASPLVALNQGYHLVFWLAALCSGLAVVLGALRFGGLGSRQAHVAVPKES